MSHQVKRQEQLVSWLKQHSQFSFTSLNIVSGDASFRRYFRFQSNQKSYIAVDAPPETEDVNRFIAVAEAYSQHGVRVPAVLAVNVEQGFYVLEDFGDKQFASIFESKSVSDWYQSALKQLPAIQSCTRTAQGNMKFYDQALLDRDFGLFTEWLVNKLLSLKLDEKEQRVLRDAEIVLANNMLAQPQVGCHRDFHSRNLMIVGDDEIGVIDFQDAVCGPITYDAVSLLRDCYKAWPEQWVDAQLSALHQRDYSQYPLSTFRRWFDLTGIQRHAKAAGIFARLHLRDGKSVYLDDIPTALSYIPVIARRYTDLHDFANLIEMRVIPAFEKNVL
ncbi:phosphotransferase [Aestuariibacter sp. AA17]|uniref:Phosphotransferase n=1 Tax=Fluctibacter corallii TaxID=2984329 RepID=A0ABT3A4E3_9ALTE|nr:phosphotransferase [Aestuariibacter sp. AA17]MCV2883563.1 phosphotransferase [Aestuariibacter sp. AA17]